MHFYAFQEIDMKLKILLVSIFSILLVSCLYAGGKQNTIRDGILSVGLEYDNGKKCTDFYMSIGKAVSEKMKLRIEFYEAGRDEIFYGLETGKYDCAISHTPITGELAAAHDFSRPFAANFMVIVLSNDSPYRVQNPDGLAGLGVSYPADSAGKTFLAKLAEGGLRYTPYEYDKTAHCFDELKLGRVDAIMIDFMTAAEYVVPGSSFQIAWQGEADMMYGICLKKGNALTASIDRALDDLFKDKTVNRLSREIFGTDLAAAAGK